MVKVRLGLKPGLYPYHEPSPRLAKKVHMHTEDFEPYYVLIGPASLYQGYNKGCICGIMVR
jgi:hypothetical protein